MAVPKRKQSKTRKRTRRAHDHVTMPNLSKCSHCHEPIIPHRVCPYCGFYKGKSIVPIIEKAKKER